MKQKIAFWWLVLLMFSSVCSYKLSYAQAPKVITNSIGMKLVLIPRGTFTMGSRINEEGRSISEKQHQVTISRDCYLGATEVTQWQYEKVMGTNPSYFQKQVNSSVYPAEKVTWDDAVEFCKRLSELPEEKAAARLYRLPSEAEWEYACRAGIKTAYSFGEDVTSLVAYAWFNINCNRQPHPVGEKKPNAWGLYDMHGNVQEWCADYWSEEYTKGAVTDPMGPLEGSSRVSRGGGWPFEASRCRSAYRDLGSQAGPGIIDSGFRVALSSSKSPE